MVQQYGSLWCLLNLQQKPHCWENIDFKLYDIKYSFVAWCMLHCKNSDSVSFNIGGSTLEDIRVIQVLPAYNILFISKLKPSTNP